MRSEEHQKFLIDQYNRNRPEKDHVKDMAELNRALLTNDIKHFGMRSVTITERRVYHKVAKITIELPKDISLEDTDDWLNENTSKWEQSLDNKFKDAILEYGTGVDEVPHMNEPESDRETRYDVNNENYGGHV
jgi:poly-D-alanine transfer protein DltD